MSSPQLSPVFLPSVQYISDKQSTPTVEPRLLQQRLVSILFNFKVWKLFV